MVRAKLDQVMRIGDKISTRTGRALSTSFIYLTALLHLSLSAPAAPATFDEQREALASTIATQPESAISSLLQAGLAEGKPTQAISETLKWLGQNVPDDAMLLFHAARAAELSADWKTAI
jgi:hypothetical protein